ncbi:MAG: hypothetical protein VZR27_11345, partial [Acutalibacteraceae bacterium]|nr:hypothetical protein [Acutalibacteraceae bacterium]
ALFKSSPTEVNPRNCNSEPSICVYVLFSSFSPCCSSKAYTVMLIPPQNSKAYSMGHSYPTEYACIYEY